VASGAIDKALANFAQALEISEQQGFLYLQPVCLRSRADALLTRDPAAAEAGYRASLRFAQAQGARPVRASRRAITCQAAPG
jgi:hypothetical protein